MTRPRYIRLARWIFDLCFASTFRRGFDQVWIRGLPELQELARSSPEPLLLVSNHFSWWDGFFFSKLHRLIRPRMPYYFTLLEKSYRSNPWFWWIGGLPLAPERPASIHSMFKFLKRERETERSRGLLVSYFPQGRITPSFARPLEFQRGVLLAARALAPCHVIPVGLHIEPLNRSRPTVFISLGSAIDSSALSLERLEAQVTHELDHIQTLLAREKDQVRPEASGYQASPGYLP